ncbi:hypothetical protein HELRODRAFT_164001 [Helobdella robusta]|uniref:Uncharacterized protein n=1 Tax=Helobdella robusta TaxID=6412 RepID=T1EUR0_HELRO|nr:hypothetical protein HELRODRAFT_164001 [Helobdella robusta]ESN94204.1 hypothetical protein HELRODRAFT_164001 [Helobdella robusta]
MYTRFACSQSVQKPYQELNGAREIATQMVPLGHQVQPQVYLKGLVSVTSSLLKLTQISRGTRGTKMKTTKFTEKNGDIIDNRDHAQQEALDPNAEMKRINNWEQLSQLMMGYWT